MLVNKLAARLMAWLGSNTERSSRTELPARSPKEAVRPSIRSVNKTLYSAVGRKRWLFIGHPDAGWRSAVVYTILQSCRRHGVNTQEYLTDVLARLLAMTISQVPDLLPSRWKSPRQQG